MNIFQLATLLADAVRNHSEQDFFFPFSVIIRKMEDFMKTGEVSEKRIRETLYILRICIESFVRRLEGKSTERGFVILRVFSDGTAPEVLLASASRQYARRCLNYLQAEDMMSAGVTPYSLFRSFDCALWLKWGDEWERDWHNVDDTLIEEAYAVFFTPGNLQFSSTGIEVEGVEDAS